MNNNPYEPYENDNIESGGSSLNDSMENINSSVNPENTEHINDSTPDYTPDEYYKQNFSNEQNSAENYAKYGESFYNNDSRPAQPQNSYNNSYNSPYTNNQQRSYSHPQGNYSGYSSGYNTTASSSSPKKKEKKPVTRGALAVMLVASILCSTVLGVGGGIFASTMLNNQNSSNSLNVSKSNSDSSSYASSTSNLTTTEIVKKTADSVVEITTEQVTTGSFSQQYIQKGAGSGVIISKDGYIVTNYHVIDGASKISVTLRDKTEYTNVKVIGTYEAGDLALLKVSAKKDLSFATFGDSSKISVGDYAVVIGNPLGQLGGTVTDGIISALDREVTIDNQTMNLLQTNSEISPGNSGGGLFNGNGELIGIVNAKSTTNAAEGIGFAIPINDVQDVLSDLKKYGYVKGQIDLGMSLSDISSTAQLWMYDTSQTGVYVTSVNNGSNAAKSGFRSGDIITKVNGTQVKSTAELNAIIKKLKVGDTVTFGVYRNGQSGTIKMKLAEYTKNTLTYDNDSQNKSNDSNNFGNDFGDEDGEEGDSIWDYFN